MKAPLVGDTPTPPDAIFKWEWFSEPLDCPPDERCNPESMVGTMSHLGGNPCPFHGGKEVSILASNVIIDYIFIMIVQLMYLPLINL
jgi:hypothetical protein